MIKPFETAVPLEIFEMASNRAFRKEFVALSLRNEATIQETPESRLRHSPALAFGKGLAEVGEIGEGFHGANAGLALELGAQGIEIELSFKVVHTGLEERFAVQGAPEADGAEGILLREGLVGEVVEQFVRR